MLLARAKVVVAAAAEAVAAAAEVAAAGVPGHRVATAIIVASQDTIHPIVKSGCGICSPNSQVVLGLAAQVLVVLAAVLNPRAKQKPRVRPSRSPSRALAIDVVDRGTCRRIAKLVIM